MFISIQQPENLPWLGFFDKIQQVDHVIILDNVQFKKRYFENRNRIRTNEGSIYLTIPVLTKGRYHQAISEVQINNSFDWRGKHWKTLCRQYHKAPFWDKYSPFFKDLYEKEWKKLVDFNMEVIKFIAQSFKLEKSFIKASDLNIEGKGEQLIFNILKNQNAKKYLSGRDGRNYMNVDIFKKEGMEIIFQNFHHPTYQQLHSPFLAGMSTIDLLFNEGKKGLEIIKHAQRD